MADLADSNEDTGDDRGVVPSRAPIIGAPRWVKVFGIIALALVLIVVISGLIGGGHGPGRHTGGLSGLTPFNVTEKGQQPSP